MNEGKIVCKDVFKIYNLGKPNEFTALRGINLEINEGDYVGIIGPSGSGKSTLLNQISCLDTPTTGEVYIEGIPISSLSGPQKSHLRCARLGFIFQQFNLIPTMTCFENIELPLRFRGIGKDQRKKRVEELLELVGLADKAKNKPSQISGGQQQRIAIARGIANDPKIILADEPTGNLDTKTGEKIMDILLRLNREEEKTLIIVTHDPEIADNTDIVVKIQDGLTV